MVILVKNVTNLVLIWVHWCILITKKKDILILGKGVTQGLHDTTLTPKAKYSVNFTEHENKFYVYITMEATVIYLLME